MQYHWRSLLTISYWRYAVLSKGGIEAFLSAFGAIFLFLQALEFFDFIQKDDITTSYLLGTLAISFLIMVVRRLPVSRISHKISDLDLIIEVRIADIWSIPGQKVIGTNNTFDTDMSNNLISPESLQGQFTNKFYPNNLAALDSLLDQELNGKSSHTDPQAPGKKQRYDIGTVVKIQNGSEFFYFLAMASLNKNGKAETDLPNLRMALIELWKFLSTNGEQQDIVIPILGTRFGRIIQPRKKIASIIVDTFLDASRQKRFSNKLIVSINPQDAKGFSVNLFEVQDAIRSIM